MSKYLATENHEGKIGKPLGSFLLSVEEVRTRVETWKESFKKGGSRHPDVPTLSSLAYDLGISVWTVNRYSKQDDYGPILARAKLFCEMHIEQKLFDPKLRPVGSIFNLKANFGWKDGSEAKATNINFTWNSVQIAAEKDRKQLEEPDDGGEPIDID